ncbi:superoxide dismutase family protein [Dietzia maris]|uniref:superoxide dismutase family protein n=1 Tax=Dietzia TaxID=37914 RepID=UPI0022B4B299|nr:superoxide dismutase family protein [Dietzia kunjamensis]MCZ4655857.1 superoxide dismutase family protein [Dietzia kunjamensis]MDJ0422325.1 superoxide dismutase family protein [Dietzia kunjamensis]
MTTRTVSTARRARRSSTFVALSATALLLASCGTGEDSPAAGGDVTPQDGAGNTSETSTSEAAAQTPGQNADGQAFATAELVNPEGESRGMAEFAEADGGTLVTVDATDLEPGFHGLHIHGTGLCEPDSENPTQPGERGAFLSAGGHLAGPGGEAGHPEHAGDLPTLYVTEDGTARIVTLTDRLDRDLLLDEDGSAVMVHENSDNLANIPERYAPEGADEETRNAGDGGSRAACGVVTEQG